MCSLSRYDALVTGSGGFIGSHLSRTFAEETTVTGFDNFSTGQRNQHPSDVEFIEGDVRNMNDIEPAVANADVVFHHAALVDVTDSISRPVTSHEINVVGTLNVLEAARKHDTRVVLASSAAIYGEPDAVPIHETDSKTPTSPYGIEKLSVDQYARRYHELYGLETVVLRYFNVYGPGQQGGDYAGVIKVFLEQARNNNPITVHGDGLQTRDFVHVDDIVAANRRAAVTDAVGQAFNIGTGDSVTIRRLAELIRETVGSQSIIQHVEKRQGDIQHSCADITTAREKLGYEPTIDLPDGLATLTASAATH